jgi:uncharacterized protein (DUF488 family)
MDKIVDEFKPLFTIGYSDLDISSFLSLLKRHMIETVADVRSSPFSGFYPEFNHEGLKLVLKTHGIKYAFLGKELGARRSEEECYVDGKVSYDLVFKTEAFQGGIQRLVNGVSKMRVVLLCAEKDPLDCHRAILICRYLKNAIGSINHILSNGQIETHRESEKRLLRHLNLHNFELFKDERDVLEDAYRRQAERIAFSREEVKERRVDRG